jgi:hypothetical protein
VCPSNMKRACEQLTRSQRGGRGFEAPFVHQCYVSPAKTEHCHSAPATRLKLGRKMGAKPPPIWAQIEGWLVSKGSRINVNFADLWSGRWESNTTPNVAKALPITMNHESLDGLKCKRCGIEKESRPGELHPEPLAEPDVNLSAHPAPIKQTRQLKGLSVARIEVLPFPVASVMRPLDPTLRSSPITSLPRSYESVRPSAPHRYARLTVLAAWASPFTSERLVPAVPRDSLHPLHAPSTPVAVRSVIRHPADLSQLNQTLLVSTTL